MVTGFSLINIEVSKRLLAQNIDWKNPVVRFDKSFAFMNLLIVKKHENFKGNYLYRAL